MADTIAITAGTGTTILTDELIHATYGTGHAQAVKLLLGGAGTGVDAVGGTGVDATGVMRVSLATNVALPAGTNAIGKLASNAGVTIGAVEVAAAQTLATVTTVGTLTTVTNAVKTRGVGEYETVAASATAQVLGATGGTGDYIEGLLVIPATTSPGNVLLLDNAISITVFTGGATSVSNLVPFFIPLGMISVSGAWKVTTGTNVSCIGVGDFT